MYGRHKDIFQCLHEGTKKYGLLYYLFKKCKGAFQNLWKVIVYRKKAEMKKPKICEQWEHKWIEEEEDKEKAKEDFFYLLCIYDYQYSCKKLKLNKKKNFRVKFLCILPFVLITILFVGGVVAYNASILVTSQNFKDFLGKNNWSFSIFGTVFYSAALILTYSVSKWLDVKQYQETWVRHSKHIYEIENEMLKYIWEREDYFDAETRKAYFVKNIMKTWDENQRKFLENMEKEKQMENVLDSLKNLIGGNEK